MTYKTINLLSGNRGLWFHRVYKISGNLFLISAMFFILTLGKPIPLQFKGFVFYSTLLGYASLIVVLQITTITLKQGKGWRQITLAIIYVVIGVMQISYILEYVHSQSVKFTDLPFGIDTGWAIVLTAISGLISSITGILSQITTRKKILADIEIEKQKLELERQKFELEKGKFNKAKKSG